MEFADDRRARIRSIASQVLPGMVLPGLVFLVLSHHASTLVAACLASSVPLADALIRKVSGRPANAMTLGFLAVAAVSVGLALLSGSAMFVLARGAVMSAVIGVSFALSAVLKRPLTRTLAIRLSTEQPEGRERLRERWHQPRALEVFCVLSVGWGLFLLVQAAQQAFVVLTLSPGAVMAIEPPVQAVCTAAGVACSLLYAKRAQASHPELQLIPARTPA
jgi:intracellular septation protein A